MAVAPKLKPFDVLIDGLDEYTDTRDEHQREISTYIVTLVSNHTFPSVFLL